MNKYYRNILAIVIILSISLTLVSYWQNWSFSNYHTILIVAGLLGIYLNLREIFKKGEGSRIDF